MSEYCSIATRGAGQSIVGTAAAETSAWIVIEYRPGWEAKGVERADFGPNLRARLDGWIEGVKGLRAQLIRRPGLQAGPLTAYLGVSSPGREQLRRLEVADYDELARVDVTAALSAMRARQEPGLGERVSHPLVLVCTHGKRDRCCAKWGRPVYDALSGREDIELWQTSHLGGHRFAATLLCLSEGLCYGWLEPGDAEPLVDAHVRGEVYRLDLLRGRTALSGPAQAAEYFIREATNEQRIAGVVVESVEASSEEFFVATTEAAGASYRLEFTRNTLAAHAPSSCGKEPSAVQRYELHSIVAL